LKQANDALQRDAKDYEGKLADESWLTRVSLTPLQTAFTDLLGVGNEQVYVGRSGWLFYRPDVEHLTARGFLEWPTLFARWHEGSEWRRAPQPDPVLAVLHFQAQLASRGIRLVLMPTPPKAAIYPEQFSSRFGTGAEAVVNRSFGQFVAEVQNPNAFFEGRFSRYVRQVNDPAFRDVRRDLDALAACRFALSRSPILVFDPGTTLVARKRAGGEAQYLRTDTHWSPSGVEGVAQALAAFLKQSVDLPAGDVGGGRSALPVRNRGDTAAMLRLPETHPAVHREQVVIQRVEGHFSASDELAPVVLLGDSYSNIYSDPGLGWGERAGLAEQLGHYLGTKVGRTAVNAGGAHASRVELARRLQELSRHQGGQGSARSDPLSAVRVVVYQFAARELSDGDWQLVDLPSLDGRTSAPVEAEPGRPLVSGSLPPPAQTKPTLPPPHLATPTAAGSDFSPLVLVGEVLRTSILPKPFSVPYDDCLTTWLLRVERVEVGEYRDETVLVVALGMEDNVWLPPASVSPGDKRRVHLIPLKRAHEAIRSTQRVDDTEDLSHLPYFALSVEEP
jgi:alginate O-acetyltransferase complex protein AlgJ